MEKNKMNINLLTVSKDTLIKIIANYADSTHGRSKHHFKEYCIIPENEVDLTYGVVEACLSYCENNGWRLSEKTGEVNGKE
jgi:putative hemolysin